jgi:hypothetical protein
MMNNGDTRFSEVPVRKLFYVKYLESVIPDVSKKKWVDNELYQDE